MIRRVLAVIAIGVAGACPRAPAQAAAESPTIADVLGPDIDRELPRLLLLAQSGIDRRWPDASIWRRAETRSTFRGSYDWHSCIAAHWAALSMARVLGDGVTAARVLARLTPEVLERERELLADAELGGERFQRMKRSFQSYADAWLVLLLDEIDRHDGHASPALVAIRRDTEDRLLTALEAAPFPENPSPRRRGRKPFNGSYRSWLFGYLMLRLSDPHRLEVRERLDSLFVDKLLPQRNVLANYDEVHPFDFLYVRGLNALVERVEPAIIDPIAFDPGAFGVLPEKVTIRDVHVVGVEISRLWPLAFDAARDPDARESFHLRIGQILARTDLWADDFKVVSHWVPQFIWLGCWLALDRP